MDSQAGRTPYANLPGYSASSFNTFGAGYLPGLLGIQVLSVETDRLSGRVPVRQKLLAPNGYLHAGTLVSVADSMCGYGTIVNLPDEAIGFVTIELKSNFLGTLRQGAFNCVATPVHIGRNTQVWDAVAEDEDSRRRLAVFRCTQMVLWDRS